MFDALPLVVVDADEKLGWDAGTVLEMTREAGLTLGARFCLALAKRMTLPAYTASPTWKAVAELAGVKIDIIR